MLVYIAEYGTALNLAQVAYMEFSDENDEVLEPGEEERAYEARVYLIDNTNGEYPDFAFRGRAATQLLRIILALQSPAIVAPGLPPLSEEDVAAWENEGGRD